MKWSAMFQTMMTIGFEDSAVEAVVDEDNNDCYADNNNDNSLPTVMTNATKGWGTPSLPDNLAGYNVHAEK